MPGEVHVRPGLPSAYGLDASWDGEVLVALGSGTRLVLTCRRSSTAAGGSPTGDDSVSLHRILATVPGLPIHLHSGGLLPVSLAHRAASLSRYPSSCVPVDSGEGEVYAGTMLYAYTRPVTLPRSGHRKRAATAARNGIWDAQAGMMRTKALLIACRSVSICLANVVSPDHHYLRSTCRIAY